MASNRLVGGVLCLTLMGACAKERETSERLAEVHYNFAVDLLTKGDLGGALRETLVALDKDKKNPMFWNLAGLVYFAQSNFPSAEDAFRKSVRFDPRFSEAYNNLGSLYVEQEKWLEAEQAFRDALKNPLYISPEKAHTNLGFVYYRLGRPQDARSQLQQALSFNPKFYLAHTHLGRLDYEAKQYEAAVRHFVVAAEGCPECQNIQLWLGEAYLALNRREDALKAFQSGARIAPESQIGKTCALYATRLLKGQ